MNPLAAASLGFADLATNVLAIVVAALLLVLALPAPPPPNATVAVDRIVAVDRAPLAPAAMVAHLAARRIGSRETAVDLRADGITVVRDGQALALRPGGTAALLAAVGRPTGPVRLDVFSNRHYATTIAALNTAGIATTELSIPAALRDSKGLGWSDGFLQLVGEAGDMSRFRAGLAALLAARDGPPRFRAGDGGGALPPPSPFRLADLTAWISAAVAVLALTAAFTVIVVVEARQLRLRR